MPLSHLCSQSGARSSQRWFSPEAPASILHASTRPRSEASSVSFFGSRCHCQRSPERETCFFAVPPLFPPSRRDSNRMNRLESRSGLCVQRLGFITQIATCQSTIHCRTLHEHTTWSGEARRATEGNRLRLSTVNTAICQDTHVPR